jgi:hypothetical protein
MATGLRNALGAGVALVMALAIVASAGPARADNPSCSPQDVWNDFSNAWASAPTCAAACGTGVGCFAAVAIAEGLAAAKAGGGSGASQFCGDVQSAQNTLSNAGAIVSDLGQVGVPQSLLQTVTDALGAVADPLAAAQCACECHRLAGRRRRELHRSGRVRQCASLRRRLRLHPAADNHADQLPANP